MAGLAVYLRLIIYFIGYRLFTVYHHNRRYAVNMAGLAVYLRLTIYFIGYRLVYSVDMR